MEWLAFECGCHSSVARSIETRCGWCGIADRHRGRGCSDGVSDGDTGVSTRFGVLALPCGLATWLSVLKNAVRIRSQTAA